MASVRKGREGKNEKNRVGRGKGKGGVARVRKGRESDNQRLGRGEGGGRRNGKVEWLECGCEQEGGGYDRRGGRSFIVALSRLDEAKWKGEGKGEGNREGREGGERLRWIERKGGVRG